LDVHKQDVKNKLFKKNDGVPQSLQSSSLRAKKAKQTLAGKKAISWLALQFGPRLLTNGKELESDALVSPCWLSIE